MYWGQGKKAVPSSVWRGVWENSQSGAKVPLSFCLVLGVSRLVSEDLLSPVPEPSWYPLYVWVDSSSAQTASDRTSLLTCFPLGESSCLCLAFHLGPWWEFHPQPLALNSVCPPPTHPPTTGTEEGYSGNPDLSSGLHRLDRCSPQPRAVLVTLPEATSEAGQEPSLLTAFSSVI